MADKLINPGYNVERTRGANFIENDTEEVGATDNRLWTESKLVDDSGSAITDTNPLPVTAFNSLITEDYDSIDLTYVSVGNGIGEIETAVYKLASATVATLTLSYNGDDKLSGVVKS